MSKRSLREKEILEVLTESDEDFSNDDDCDWIPEVSDSDSEPDIDPVGIDDMLFEDGINTEDEADESVEAEEDSLTAGAEMLNTEVNWTEFSSRQKTFTFTGKSGIQQNISSDISCLDTYLLFVDNDIIDLIVKETNQYAQEILDKTAVTRSSRKKQWVPTTNLEIKKFLGLLLWMGLVKVGSLSDYWSKNHLYNFTIPGKTMSRNRFQLLLSFMHFADNSSIIPGDRLGKIQPLLDMLQMRYQKVYVPGENIVIDETLIPWRGRLVFRQYIPNKAHPYGIKLFKLCSTEGFTWSLKIYSGKSATGVREVGLAKNVCEYLITELKGEGRTLYVDNFYTSYELARSMLNNKTHLVGTLRANKKYLPKEVMNSALKKGELVAQEDENGIVVLKWKDKRDVRMLSTKHAPVMISDSNQEDDPNIPSTSRAKRRKSIVKSKPLAIIEYNKGKAGIDLSDQMVSYGSTLRKGLKWYRKLGIELLLGLSIVNAHIVYKEATKKNINIRKFRQRVANDLLDLTSPQAVNPGKHIITKRVDANNKAIRRSCVLCYATAKKQLDRKTARNHLKKTSTYCPKCPNTPHLCLQCFPTYAHLK